MEGPDDLVYLDNAATSFPKPAVVHEAVSRFSRSVGASPGRSAHRLGIEASRILYSARRALAVLLGVSDCSRLVFTSGCTEALNLAIKGILRPGDHAVATQMEHNSVMRPLRGLQRRIGIDVAVVPANEDGGVSPERVLRAITSETRLVVMTLASNVTGAILPYAEVIEGVKRLNESGRRAKRIYVLADAAQAGGVIPLHLDDSGLDFVALSGHKGLMGPQGTGALYVAADVDESLIEGGTGTESGSEQQPERMPERFESGTLNAPGIAGLGAALEFLQRHGVETVRRREAELLGRLIEGLRSVEGVELYGPLDPARQVGVLSINLPGLTPGALAGLL